MLTNSKITIEGRQLKSVYAVYVIELFHKDNKYYYVGQTGDAHYISARPSFSRIGGHLENTSRSTQNQIYKYIIRLLGIDVPEGANDYDREDKARVEDFLSESKITMHIYPLIEFNYMATHQVHTNNRRQVLEFEKQVISLFGNANKILINTAIHEPQQEIGTVFPGKFRAVQADFGI